ncbi:DUF484 family protein [Reinekea marina]|uniref:DUF484 family protein n=1 Tax=Reinekea marina TaxID=1310421 RepID=A0ABV7WVN2_9GAMM|nr:DUF484 family protein [Reinekea marina]MDN3647381.1 DUF484 family protein [Reinekea marina]
MINNDEFSEEDIVRYLKQHPSFFEHHPMLLKRLHLQHDSGQAISLIERQNHIFRQENRDLIDRLNKFINVAQRNDRLFLKLQALVLKLIECEQLNEMAAILQKGLIENFDVDDVQLVLSHQVSRDGDLWLHCDKHTLLKQFPSVIKDQKSSCGIFDEETRSLLFGQTPMGSLALGAIKCKSGQVGILALGSKSDAHFRSGTDTLFLSHLANVISRLLDRFSD